MAFQQGVLLLNAKLNAVNTNLGATATLKVFTGAEAVNCAAADPAGTLATITLPSTPFAAASLGVVAMTGTWSVARQSLPPLTIAATSIHAPMTIMDIEDEDEDETVLMLLAA